MENTQLTNIDKEKELSLTLEEESNILAHIVYRNGTSLEDYHDDRMDKVISIIYPETKRIVGNFLLLKFGLLDIDYTYNEMMQYCKTSGFSYNSSWDAPTDLYNFVLDEVDRTMIFPKDVPYALIAKCITNYLFYGKVKEAIDQKWYLYDDKMKILNKDIHNRIYTLLKMLEKFDTTTVVHFVLAY